MCCLRGSRGPTSITDEQTAALNSRITANHRDQRWLYEVITERANIEDMLNEPHREPFDFKTYYLFSANVLRLNPLFNGFHPSEFAMSKRRENPCNFANALGIEIQTLDDHLAFIGRVFALAKAPGCVGLKQTPAYERTLSFNLREEDARRFGREILRENAPTIFPGLKAKIWRHKQAQLTPLE